MKKTKNRRLFYAEHKILTPSFSPDGRYIIFVHQKDKWSTSGTITLIHVVTGDVKEVLPEFPKMKNK
jgi:Tol biopolymer transport system component